MACCVCSWELPLLSKFTASMASHHLQQTPSEKALEVVPSLACLLTQLSLT